jgi:diphosphomevalonate decarboxylase
MDCIAILSEGHKPIGSQAGMGLANTSPLQKARVTDSKRRLEICRSAIRNRDFEALAKITELDSNLMHAVMMTSAPPLFYWEPQSLAIMKAVKDWQKDGLQATYTLDAGPNVHVICTQDVLDEVLSRLQRFPGVIKVLHGGPGGPARLIPNPD